jgi:hypothetical protein
MRAIKAVVPAVVFALMITATMRAQSAPDLAAVGSLAKHGDIGFRDIEAGALLKAIASVGEIDVQITPEAETLLARRINVDFKNAELANLFNFLVKLTNCSYTIIDARTILIAAN